MGRIGYLFKVIKKMDKTAMLRKVKYLHEKTGKNSVFLFFDMVWCGLRYGAGYIDYDLYEMYNLNAKQRNTYITRGRNNTIYKKLNQTEYIPQIESKDNFDTNFDKYLKRDWMKTQGSDKEQFIEFFKRHDQFMAKPIDGACGKRIEKITVAEWSSLDELYDHLKDQKMVLEEMIIQHPDVAAIYPKAINTVRTVTMLVDGEAHVVATYFRIGNGDHYVDNFNSEGMVAPVDENTGIVLQPAIDKKKNLYEVHPQTGTKIQGFRFPFWEEALAMCKEAAHVIPQMGYVGWDVAFTPDGPVFVEANDFPGHDIYQLPEHTPDKIGVWPKFKQYLK